MLMMEKEKISKLKKRVINKALKVINDNGFKTKNVKFGDGYFFYEFGDNSVCHFYIDELPDWKFGIWIWEDDKDENKLKVFFFAQIEEFIDKFKPSASSIEEEFFIEVDKLGKPGSTWWDFKILQNLEYMRDHPYLAMYRDIFYADFNYEYVSKEDAKEKVVDAFRRNGYVIRQSD